MSEDPESQSATPDTEVVAREAITPDRLLHTGGATGPPPRTWSSPPGGT